MGEQPNPWNRLQLRNAMSRHRGAKPPRRCEPWGDQPRYPQGSFYPLSDGLSIQHRRITKPDSSSLLDRSRSQNTLCLCTPALGFPIQAEGIFGRLCYFGRRPSQSNCPTDTVLSTAYVVRLEIQYNRGSIPNSGLNTGVSISCLHLSLAYAASNPIST